MPQESLRSVVYRSFVTCEDPRGVVEGKTIKVSKTDTTKMGSRRVEHETQSKNSKEKEKMSSYQLVEVKNGARKLNETIDSWSKGVSFKGQPKDIAKDLLKGALDLQESLMMLGKLQEASCMAKFKKKQEKPSEVLVSKIGSDRFESFRNHDMGNQNQRNLVDGSSRDCYSELREVIRDGLSKQNLLPHKSYQESVFAGNGGLTGRRKLQLSPDIASTSSSRSSSMVYSTHEFTSSESFSSRATEEKSKGTNLIAKLMGLEDFPSKPVISKQLDRNRMNPVFDVDLPNAKKPQFFVPKLDREHMTLDEIIEMMQSKGILRSNKREIKETSERFRDDDAPPIVLMKPQRLVPDNQKVKANENRIRKLHQEKAKSEDKPIKIKGNLSSNKPKTSVPVVTKPGRKQEMEKKIDKIQKMAPSVKRKPVENVKLTNSVSKKASLKQVKPKRTLSSVSVSCTSKSSNQKKKANLKIEKPVDEPLPTIVHEVLQNENETEDSEARIREIDNVRQQLFCEAFKEGSDSVNDAVTGTDQSATRNNHEESDVSNVRDQKARILETISGFQDSEPANLELFQDCVNEFLEHENRRQNPWLQTSMLTSRFCVSEDQLMMKIVKGIENVRTYSMFWKESCNVDTVSGLLERDLCWSTMGGSWSSGWKHGCTVNEVEEVVLDLEKMVLSKLIDDVLMELVP